ncbi:AMP-binding protein [Paenalcaligenes sp. Me52]|uniref:AMP-binding protein n=1 Tax=Paenalcaligenes sp. Me52 TaxID=3392038 RepID=UPI003D2BC58B
MSHTIYSVFQSTAKQWPNNDFITVLPETAEIYGIDAGSLSYTEALHRIDQLAEQYQKAGYGQGHRIGLLLENRPVFLLHWLALNKLGASIVPINPDLRIAELSYLVQHSDMVLAISLASRVNDLNEAAAQNSIALPVITPEQPFPAASTPARADGPLGLHTECALLYTSGTTGLPKGCVLTNEYFDYAGDWYATVGGLAHLEPGKERMLTPLPLFHMNALATSTMAIIKTGGCIIVLDRFHPRSWWDSVRLSKATIVHYLGVMPAILMKLPASSEDTNHCVRFGFGAGVEKTLHHPFETRFGFPLLEAWAMTETGAAACVIANEEPRFIGTSCFGKESDNVDILLVDDNGQPVPNGVNGELLVRRAGPNPRFGFFSEYWKDPAATEAAWADGWFHTGDIVMRDEHGYLHFIDRKRNVIRRSGENIAAVEVENALQQHPAIRSIAVSAVPDSIRGDEVMALIITHEAPANPTALAEEIVKWALTQLAYFKVPGYVVFVDAVPLTSTNKIQRGELKAKALALLQSPECIDTNHLKKRQER